MRNAFVAAVALLAAACSSVPDVTFHEPAADEDDGGELERDRDAGGPKDRDR